MTPEQKTKFKKEKIEYCDKEIAELEIAIADIKKQRDGELKHLEEKLDSLKYQKELYG